MRVLLRDDVAGVGRRGDIVKVAGGFARNFLLPGGRAIVASDGAEGQAEQMRRRRDLREAEDKAAAEGQAKLLAGAVIPISARAAGGGRLYGSVGPVDVADAIRAAKGIEVDRAHVLLPDHIKETGSFDVTVDLFRDVSVVVTVEVTAAR
jgi:large subunit ribosomal protein L9